MRARELLGCFQNRHASAHLKSELAQFLIAYVDHIFERQLLGLKRMQDAFRILQLQILQPLC